MNRRSNKSGGKKKLKTKVKRQVIFISSIFFFYLDLIFVRIGERFGLGLGWAEVGIRIA